jgi:hypothetical protein
VTCGILGNSEKVQGTTVKDDDFMRISRPITFEWGGKFLEAQQTIETYDIYIIILLKKIRLCVAVSDVNIFSKTDVYILSKHKFNTFHIPFQE